MSTDSIESNEDFTTLELSEIYDDFVTVTRDSRGKNKATKNDVKQAVNFMLDVVDSTYFLIAQDKDKYNWEPPKTDPNKKSIIMTLFDAHFGELIVKEDPYAEGTDVDIETSYNFEIAEKNLNKIYDRTVEIMNNYGMERFDEFIIAIGGDNVDGDGTVYPHQSHEVDGLIFQQVVKFQFAVNEIIAKASSMMKKLDGIVRVIGIPGNHGRNKANPSNHPVRQNYDYLTYLWIESFLIRDKQELNKLDNVFMSYSHISLTKGFQTKGWKYIMRHALPKNLLTPSAENKVNNLSKIYDADVLLTGHFHQTAMVRSGNTTVIRTGCLPGPNEYSDELSIHSDGAEQLAIVVSKNNAIESLTPLLINGV